MDLGDLGEFGLIRRIKKWMDISRPDLIQGIGDDVAVVDLGNKVLLATTDILIEDIHFERSWIDAYHLGKKSLMVNISDIAAMGGIPKYFLISLGLPKHLPLSFILRFYRGLKDGAKQFGVALVGGDTSLSQKIVINICLLGEGRKGRLLFRKGAQVGDDLFVSGTLGDSALGLGILQKKGAKGKPVGLIKKHLSPAPRLQLGQTLAKRDWATAMIDVSDGLLIDTSHLLEESGVGALIWEDRIPLSQSYRKYAYLYSRTPYDFAFHGGEDYELLFTAPRRVRDRISLLSRRLKLPISRIGEILSSKEGFHIVRSDGSRYLPSLLGFDHFRRKR